MRYLDSRIRLAEREADRLRSNPAQACAWQICLRERFMHRRRVFEEHWGCDLNRAFRYLADSGKVDVLASGATHCLLPALGTLSADASPADTEVGVQQYRKMLRPIAFRLLAA